MVPANECPKLERAGAGKGKSGLIPNLSPVFPKVFHGKNPVFICFFVGFPQFPQYYYYYE